IPMDHGFGCLFPVRQRMFSTLKSYLVAFIYFGASRCSRHSTTLPRWKSQTGQCRSVFLRTQFSVMVVVTWALIGFAVASGCPAQPLAKTEAGSASSDLARSRIYQRWNWAY